MKLLMTCLVMLCLAFPAYSFAGIEWVSTIKTIDARGKKYSNDIVAHSYAESGNIKQVFENLSREDMYYFQDGYWLYKAGEDNIYIVNEKEETYTVIPIDGLLQVTGALGQIAELEIVDHSIQVEELDGEDLLSYPCDHIRVTTDYTMRVKIAFIKKTMKVHEVKDIWSTSAIAEFDKINDGFQRKTFRTGIPELDEMIQKEIENQKKIGFPLKVNTKTIQMNKKGKTTQDSTTTITVSEVKIGEFPKNFFEIPGFFERNSTFPG